MKQLKGIYSLKGLMWPGLLMLLSITASAQISIEVYDQDGNPAVIPAEHIQAIKLLPNTNVLQITTSVTYTIEPACEAEPCEEPPPPAVDILSFTVTSPIDEGASTSLSWSTENATACTPSGDVAAWTNMNIGTSSNGTSVTIASAGTYEFGLNCTGDGNPDQATRFVTVNAPDGDPDPDNCPDPALSGSNINWATLWGTEFPGPIYRNSDMGIPRNGYKAIKFNTGNAVDNGSIASVGNTKSDGKRFGALSTCPGVFDVAPECDHKWGTGGAIRWATNGSVGCQLEPNTDYYINMTFTNGTDPDSSTCTTPSCIATMQHVNRSE